MRKGSIALVVAVLFVLAFALGKQYGLLQFNGVSVSMANMSLRTHCQQLFRLCTVDKQARDLRTDESFWQQKLQEAFGVRNIPDQDSVVREIEDDMSVREFCMELCKSGLVPIIPKRVDSFEGIWIDQGYMSVYFIVHGTVSVTLVKRGAHDLTVTIRPRDMGNRDTGELYGDYAEISYIHRRSSDHNTGIRVWMHHDMPKKYLEMVLEYAAKIHAYGQSF